MPLVQILNFEIPLIPRYLNNSINNDQESPDRAGESDELPDAQNISATDAENSEEAVDVQLRYAIKLLKNMSNLPKAQMAEVRQ